MSARAFGQAELARPPELELETVRVAVALVPPPFTVNVDEPGVAEAFAEAVKVAEFVPDGTVTELGAAITVPLFVIVQIAPPVGAGPVSVTVPTELPPADMDAGEKDSEATPTDNKLKGTVIFAVPSVAEIFAVVNLETAFVEILKLAVEPPAETTTDEGTVADGVEDEIRTFVPPGPAAPLKLSVPDAEFPPVTDVGDKERPESDAGLTLSVPVTFAFPVTAVRVTVTVADTGDVKATNVADFAPAGTTSEDGAVAAAELEECNVTDNPPEGAAALIETVPVALTPPVTTVGVSLSEVTFWPHAGTLEATMQVAKLMRVNRRLLSKIFIRKRSPNRAGRSRART